MPVSSMAGCAWRPPDTSGLAAGVPDSGEGDPLAESWFKASAGELLSRVGGYVAILDAHAIAWEEVRTTDPGTIIYEDRWQAVAIPVTLIGQEANATIR